MRRRNGLPSLGSPISDTASRDRIARVFETIGRTLLVPVALLIPLSPEIGATGLRPEDFLLVTLGVVLVVDLLFRPVIDVYNGQFFVALLAVWLTSVLATVIGALLGTATLLSLNPIESGSLTIAKETELVVLFLLVARYVRTEETARRLLGILCVGGSILASVLIFELVALRQGAIVPHQEFHLMGEIFGFAASLALGRVIFGSAGSFERLAFGVMFGITAIGVLVSGEAGAMVGATVAGGMLVIVGIDCSELTVSFRTLVLASVIIGGLVLAVLLTVPRFATIASNQVADLVSILSGNPRFSVEARFRHWAERIPEVLTTRPLLGFGQMAIPPGGLDNEFFQRLYYTGLLGLAAYVFMLLSATRMAFSGAVRDNTGFVGGYAGVVGIMIGAGLAKGVFHSTKTSAFFVMASALIAVLLYRGDYVTDA